MRKFIRDIILRSAEIIQERERNAQTSPVNGQGRPSACMFCEHRPTFQVFDENGIKSAFVCDEHVGPLVTTWTLSNELVLVRL